ncbi:ankyrin repeat domain-containing protein [Actinomycetes bacterium M1A6_2h]
MTTIGPEDPIAVSLTAAIQTGDVKELLRLLTADPDLATVRIGDDGPGGMSRPLLHVVADWPGHFPDGARTVHVLVDAGADVRGRFRGPHRETALHWAASSNDVAVLDALLDCGAEIDAPGGVIGGGTPLADARAFRQWNAAFRLIERGAAVNVFDAATLGLLDRVEQHYRDHQPSIDDTNRAFWSACHGGRLNTARFLYGQGGDIELVPPWAKDTVLEAAVNSGSGELTEWIRTLR